jgi:hypothetical protein
MGQKVSATKAGQLLYSLGYSIQVERKPREGAQPPPQRSVRAHQPRTRSPSKAETLLARSWLVFMAEVIPTSHRYIPVGSPTLTRHAAFAELPAARRMSLPPQRGGMRTRCALPAPMPECGRRARAFGSQERRVPKRRHFPELDVRVRRHAVQSLHLPYEFGAVQRDEVPGAL